jgi:AraC-like DNA-binding protein
MKQLPDHSAEPVDGASARLAQHCAIGRFVARRPELSLHVVRRARGKSSWQALDETSELTLPRSFERGAALEAERRRHYEALCEQAVQSRQLEWRARHGFSDFAYLLSDGREGQLLLLGLEHASAPLDYRALEQSFAAITATLPQSPNPAFAQYVTAALSRPVLGERLCAELLDFCALMRSFGVSDTRPGSAPPAGFAADPRARREAGVIAIALAPIDAGRSGRDPLRALVDARRLLHEVQSFACDYSGAVALPLEDYGVLLTLPVQAGAKAPPRAADARKLAEKARQLSQRQLSLTTVAGTALALAAPESREAVAQRAVLALRTALETGQAVLLLEDVATGAKAVRHSHVLQALDRLSSTFERQTMTEAAAMAHGFIHTVSAFSGGRLDIVRAQFVLAVTQIAKAIQRRHCLGADMPERWGDEAALRLDACASFEALSDELKRTLNRLAVLATSSDGPSYLRIDDLLDYLRHNLAEPVKLPQLARRTGFSVPSFCRVFKRATGHSLLSYVRGLRIDRAKHLLATTELPNTSVAELSGFHSQHHFIRSFKKVMRSTPGEYRRALTELAP